MGDRTHRLKSIVAALLLTVGFSIPALADEARLDDLFAQLRDADAQAAALIEAEIRSEWSRSGSAAVDLLLRRAGDALEAGEYGAAIEHYTAAIDYAPEFAEAYNGRATAYYLTDRIGPAIDDLRQTLVLNPRHFEAMRGFAILLDELGRRADSLEVFRQVQAIHPSDPDVAAAVDRLELLLEGQTL